MPANNEMDEFRMPRHLQHRGFHSFPRYGETCTTDHGIIMTGFVYVQIGQSASHACEIRSLRNQPFMVGRAYQIRLAVLSTWRS